MHEILYKNTKLISEGSILSASICVKPMLNLFVTKLGKSFVIKPKVVSMLKSELSELKYYGSVFDKEVQKLSIDDIKIFFPNDKLSNSIFRREMYKVKTGLFFKGTISRENYKKWLHSVDLSNPIKDSDYRELVDFINLYNGKYLDVWRNKKYGMNNIEKLALFIRSLKRIDKFEYFKSLSPKEWETCIEGIINIPEYVIKSLMKYKLDSSNINGALSLRNGSLKINDYINRIEKFLETQSVKTNLKTYRGEGNFWLFNKNKIINDRTLKNELEEISYKLRNGLCKEKDGNLFAQNFLLNKTVIQERFMSTAMLKDDAEKYAKEILWDIEIPKGTKASFIENYNVERDSESEILIQRGAELFIKNANYNFAKKRWDIWAVVRQILKI